MLDRSIREYLCDCLQDFAIEFVTFAIDFVLFAIEFISLQVDSSPWL